MGLMERLSLSEVRRRGVTMFSRFGTPLNLSTNEFGELRTTGRNTVFAFKQLDGAPNGELVAYHTAGGGSYSYDYYRSGVQLAVDNRPNAIAVMQSRSRPNYQAGHRHIAALTAGAPTPALGCLSEVGLFDDYDGIFWRRTYSTDSFVLRSSVSGAVSDAREVVRANWNYDKFDGRGPSRVLLEAESKPIFFVAYTWFGSGNVWCGFIVDDMPCLGHVYGNSKATAPYMRTPNLPVRWQLRNGPDGANAASTLLTTCAAVEAEGGQSPLGIPGAVGNQTPLTLVADTHTEIVSLRLKPGYDRTVFPINGVVSSISNASGITSLLWNATLTGAGTWLDAGGALQYNVASRVITDHGRRLSMAPYTQATRSAEVSLQPLVALGRAYDGTPDVLTLGVYAAGVQSVYGAINYREVP